jgi:hypothetical protein
MKRRGMVSAALLVCGANKARRFKKYFENIGFVLVVIVAKC